MINIISDKIFNITIFIKNYKFFHFIFKLINIIKLNIK